jgi:predicted nucleic acid-binding protein
MRTKKVLVDTNVAIDVLRGKPQALALLDEHLGAGNDVAISVLTRFELLAGARPNELSALIEHLTIYSEVQIDDRIADRAAEHSRQFRRSHSSIDAIDYLIAATAQVEGAELLTLNVKHFPMIHGLAPAYQPIT